MFKENFTEKELNEAKQNGFILAGKTGAGKSTFINMVLGEEAAEVKSVAFAVTKVSQIYYHKLKNGKCIALVDTPGLSDPDKLANNQEDIDNIHLEGIGKKISEEKIHIKGILFLVNFQMERFDDSEQEALLNYNRIFPLPDFWKNLIVIFTHWFPDPYGPTLEEMIKNKSESNGQIFSKLMDRVKNVSNPIYYKDLRINYLNSYCPARHEKQKEINSNNKNIIEKIFDEMIHKKPLISQIEIQHINNVREEEDGKTYLVDYEIIYYFDLNQTELYKEKKKINKKEIKEKKIENLPPPVINKPVVFKAKKDNKGNLGYVKEEGNKNNSKVVQNSMAKGLLGGIGTGFSAGYIAYALAGGAAAGASVISAPVLVPAAVAAVIGHLIFR